MFLAYYRLGCSPGLIGWNPNAQELGMWRHLDIGFKQLKTRSLGWALISDDRFPPKGWNMVTDTQTEHDTDRPREKLTMYKLRREAWSRWSLQREPSEGTDSVSISCLQGYHSGCLLLKLPRLQWVLHYISPGNEDRACPTLQVACILIKKLPIRFLKNLSQLLWTPPYSGWTASSPVGGKFLSSAKYQFRGTNEWSRILLKVIKDRN